MTYRMKARGHCREQDRIWSRRWDAALRENPELAGSMETTASASEIGGDSAGVVAFGAAADKRPRRR